MALKPTQEGTIAFNIPTVDTICSTYYKVFGDLSCGRPPVLVLHGGPGGGHNYCLPFAELWPKYGLPVILYDQIGCGKSTHLQHKAGNHAFWTEELFLKELENVVSFFKLQDPSGPGFDIIGQSWGGMLGSAFASTRPKGLRRLVLAGGVASIELSIKSIDILRAQLPDDVREALNEAEKKGDFESPAYNEAMMMFYQKHLCREDPFPEDLSETFRILTEDKTVYGTMYGPSTLTCIGSLVGWTVIPRLPQITAPTMIFNGEFDSSHDICTAPFFEHIPHARWITFAGGSHMCHMEGNGLQEKVLNAVGQFLTAEAPAAGKEREVM